MIPSHIPKTPPQPLKCSGSTTLPSPWPLSGILAVVTRTTGDRPPAASPRTPTHPTPKGSEAHNHHRHGCLRSEGAAPVGRTWRGRWSTSTARSSSTAPGAPDGKPSAQMGPSVPSVPIGLGFHCGQRVPFDMRHKLLSQFFLVYNLSKASGVHMEVADTGAQLLPAFPPLCSLGCIPFSNLGHLSGVSQCGRPG